MFLETPSPRGWSARHAAWTIAKFSGGASTSGQPRHHFRETWERALAQTRGHVEEGAATLHNTQTNILQRSAEAMRSPTEAELGARPKVPPLRHRQVVRVDAGGNMSAR